MEVAPQPTQRQTNFFFISSFILAIAAFVGVIIKQTQNIVNAASQTNSINGGQGRHPKLVPDEAHRGQGAYPTPKNVSQLTGRPAIVPQSKSATENSARITEAEIRTYVSAHPIQDLPVINGGILTIRSVQFMAATKAMVAINARLKFPDPNAIICIVTLHGPFSLQNLSIPPALKDWHYPPTSDIVYQLFDGQTGNLIGERIPGAKLVKSGGATPVTSTNK